MMHINYMHVQLISLILGRWLWKIFLWGWWRGNASSVGSTVTPLVPLGGLVLSLVVREPWGVLGTRSYWPGILRHGTCVCWISGIHRISVIEERIRNRRNGTRHCVSVCTWHTWLGGYGRDRMRIGHRWRVLCRCLNNWCGLWFHGSVVWPWSGFCCLGLHWIYLFWCRG